jgi:hypothetical protein
LPGSEAIRWPAAFSLGAILGFAPVVEYTAALFSALLGVVFLVILIRRRPAPVGLTPTPMAWWATLVPLALGALIPIGFLMFYNTVNFGGPLELSTFNVDTALWANAQSLGTNFATPLGFGLWALLVYGADNQGLFLLAPVTLLSLPGMVYFLRHARGKLALFVGLFAAMLLLYARSTTFNPLTNDSRYLTPYLGLWLAPLAFWLDEFFFTRRGDLPRLLWGMVFFGLFLLSLRNQFFHIAFSWNYDLDLADLKSMAALPKNLLFLFLTVFRNTGNLPILWLGEAMGVGIAALTARWRGQWSLSVPARQPEGSQL